MARTNLITVVMLMLLPVPSLAADAEKKTSPHEAAVLELFKTMRMDETMTKSTATLLEAEVKQTPAIARFRPALLAFLEKHKSWKSIEPEMTSLYMKEFTEEEIKELTAFYKTPVGQKVLAKTPTLMAKGAELGQARVQQNLPELQKVLAEEESKQKP